MLPAYLFQVITLTADIFLFLFVGYYILKLHKREKELERREQKIDSNYHHVVDDTLAKERKILDDAVHEADDIITGAKYIKSDSQKSVDAAIHAIVVELQKDSTATAKVFMQSYTNSLEQMTNRSVGDFQTIVKNLETDLQSQIKTFHATLLPKMEKEIEEYKQVRFKQTEETITSVIQRASQEILNKTISLEDHHALMIQALDKAKKEGIFG